MCVDRNMEGGHPACRSGAADDTGMAFGPFRAKADAAACPPRARNASCTLSAVQRSIRRSASIFFNKPLSSIHRQVMTSSLCAMYAQGGKFVGFYDLYDFYPKPFGQRNFKAEVGTRAAFYIAPAAAKAIRGLLRKDTRENGMWSMKSLGICLVVAILASATVLTAFDASSTAPCLIMSCEMDDASQRAMAFTGFYVQELILFGFWVLFVPSCIFFRFLAGRSFGTKRSLAIGIIVDLLLFSYVISELIFFPRVDSFFLSC